MKEQQQINPSARVKDTKIEVKVEAEAILCRDGIWDLKIKCPYCQKEHFHGGGRGRLPSYGFRLFHCFPSSKGEYELVAKGGGDASGMEIT